MAGPTYKMHYVYILQSVNYPVQIYTGSTENLKERLISHNSGANKHTSKFKPWKVIWYCSFSNEDKAILFEKYLKTASGIAFKRKRLL
jgi:predicted GIY-YIG superfamily endonuclease